MVPVLCILPLALAAVSAVSGHVIRRQHNSAPSGWETSILQDYDAYHTRYLEWGCQKQHNTTFFDKCCHPLLKGEPMSAIEDLGCGCDDGDSSVPSSLTPTPTPSSTPQAAQANSSPSTPPSSSPKPANAALAKGSETPTSTPPPETPTSTPTKSSTSPAPAQTSGSGSGNGGDVHSGGQATFFYQKGQAGACGTVHSDSDLICAIDSALFNQNLCGKSVQITNTATKQTVTVVVADECPTCENANSIDLSMGAFGQIGTQEEGVVPIKWVFA